MRGKFIIAPNVRETPPQSLLCGINRIKISFRPSTVFVYQYGTKNFCLSIWYKDFLSINMVQRFFVYQYGTRIFCLSIWYSFFSINMVQGFLCPSTVSRNNPLTKSNPFDGKLFKFKHFIERKNPENYDGDKL